jgi:Tol biopolymer transport system component/DNA-binding winged helix-turn-helix (wHTH) protein
VATPANTAGCWRFGLFEVDAHREELRRAGTPIKLREQSFRILVFLLEHPGEIVTREDLRRVLWPADTFVDFDHSLNTAVMKLREALGDTADNPLYIETVPKRGYRFIAPVSSATGQQDGVASSNGEAAVRETIAVDAPSQALPAEASVQGRRTLQFVIACGLILLAAVASLLFLWKRHLLISKHDTGEASSDFHILPVTSAPGIVIDPAVSPDGREILYVWYGPGRNRPDLYVVLIGSDTPLRIGNSERGSIGSPFRSTDWLGGGPSWSPDGRVIAFTRCEGMNGNVYLVPALGGTERRLTSAGCPHDIPSSLAWSPDGTRIVMIDHCSTSGPFGLVVFSLATGEKRCLTDSGPLGFEREYVFSLSPGGDTIAFIPSWESMACEIYTIPISGGTPHRIMKDDYNCSNLMWTPDGQSIVFASARNTQPSLWRVLASGGVMQRETLFPAIGSFSKDGRVLVYPESTSYEPDGIWRADLTRAGGPLLTNRKLIGTQFDEVGAQPSPDGARIVWASERSGSAEIWVSDATGGNPVQLTHIGGYCGTPRWSPDGKWITFDSHTTKSVQIFVVDSEGRNLHPITDGSYPSEVPSWSRDGKWIYFASKRTGKFEVWKHSLESGTEIQLTTHGGFDPFESYDGRTIYFSRFDEGGIWSIPSQGGVERLVLADKPQVRYWGHWAVTMGGLYLLNAEAEPRPRIEFYDFATHRVSPVLTIEKRAAWYEPGLSATADGRTIYYSQWDHQSVIKVMEFSQ